MNFQSQVARSARQSPEQEAVTPPLTSVVVNNYNYGRFLQEAIESVYRQTYPAVECIVVDDCSTDNSRAVIDNIRASYPQLTAVFRQQNGGQSLACKDGFDASSGQYVVFLDADDFLLPNAIATHIFTHLSMRVPVGFSSADMLQCFDGEMVLGTRQCLSDYVRSGRGRQKRLFRSISQCLGTLSPLPEDEKLQHEVHLVEPGTAMWVWSPMSGNCYRRDALKIVLGNPALGNLKRSTDAYLNLGINLLTGSVLIDRPIAVYRMHGENGLSRHPQLNGFFSFKRSRAMDNPQRSRLLLIDHFLDCADDLISRSTPQHLLQALEELGRHASAHGSPYYLTRQLRRRRKDLRRHLGVKAFWTWWYRLYRKKI